MLFNNVNSGVEFERHHCKNKPQQGEVQRNALQAANNERLRSK